MTARVGRLSRERRENVMKRLRPAGNRQDDVRSSYNRTQQAIAPVGTLLCRVGRYDGAGIRFLSCFHARFLGGRLRNNRLRPENNSVVDRGREARIAEFGFTLLR